MRTPICACFIIKLRTRCLIFLDLFTYPQCIPNKLPLSYVPEMFLLKMMFLLFRVFATATVIQVLKPGSNQKCIVKDNCFRTPNHPNPYVAADCYAEVINTARVIAWSNHFHMFSSNAEKESTRDALTIEHADSAQTPRSFFADRGPNNIELSRGDRFIRTNKIECCVDIPLVRISDFDYR